MRILYLTGGMPYPLTSGRLRHYHLAHSLAARHELTLLATVGQPPEPADVRALEEFAALHLEPTGTVGSRRSLVARITNVLGIADSAARRQAATIDGLVKAGRADVIVLTGKDAFALLRTLGRPAPIVYDLCDARSLNLRRQLRYAPLWRRPALAARYLATRRRELQTAAASDATIFASSRDRDAVLGVRPSPSIRAAVVPNGIDVDYWSRQSPRLGDAIVMTGAMDYAPNVDAALQLTDVILPRVRQAVPDARCLIVGRDPPARLHERTRIRGVTVTGYVEDVRPYLEQAAVFTAPLRFGAGIQNKLLEAMAMEVPCVTTPLAADGIRGEDGSAAPIDVTSEPDAFAAHVVRRLNEAAAGAAPARVAREYVAQRFSWAAASSKLERVLLELHGSSDGG